MNFLEGLGLIGTIFGLVATLLGIYNIIVSRKDKSTKDAKDEQKQFSKHDLIEWRLDDITKKVDKILDKLDVYDKEIDEKIKNAFKHHIAEFHKGIER